MSNSKSLSKNVIFNGILNIFNIVLPLVVMKVVIKAIGKDLYGYMSTGESLYNFFYIFASFGICTYGLREMSKIRDDKTKIKNTFTSLFIITTITNIISTVFYMLFVLIFYNGKPYFQTCILMGLNLASNIFFVEWVNQALENYKFITIKTIVIRTVSYILFILFVHSEDDYLFYLNVLVVSNFLNNLTSFIYIKKQISFDFSDLEFKKHLTPMIYAVILSNVGVLYTQLDKFMLQNQLGTTTVGYYTFAQRIITMINLLMLTLVTVSIPRLSNYIGNNLKDEYLSLLTKISKTYFAILFPSAIGLICLSDKIVAIFNYNYLSAQYALIAFSIYMITLGIQNIISNQIIYIHQKEKEDSLLIFIGGVANVILNFSLIALNIFTVTNVVITTIISNSLTIFLQYRLAKKCIGSDLKLFSFDNFKYLLFSAMFFPITIFTKTLVSNDYAVCAVDIILCTLTYGAILFITKDELFFTAKNHVFKRIQAILE